MNHTKTLTALTLCAALLLSSCNTDKPAETSPVTEEVTTTAAAETTTVETATAESTTTEKTKASVMTTAVEEESEAAKKYFVDCNERPFDSKALEIFENAFYGSWRCTDTRGASMPETLVLTYAESPFTFESWYYPRGIIETDEIFAITFINGGVGGCFVIEKSDPDVMYEISEYNCSDFVIDEHAYIYTDRSDCKTPVIPVHDKLSVFGMYRLENEYGEEFTRRFEEAYNEDYADKDGRVWWVDGDMGMPVEKRSIIDRTESSVIITLTYRDKEEYIGYLKGDHEVEPTERQYALVFEKNDSGEWELTEMFRADFDGYSELIEKYFLGVWRSESGDEYIIGKDPENKYVDLLRGRIGYVKKVDNTVELFTYNYIGDEYRLVIDINEPDTALSYDFHAEANGYFPEKFTRTDNAEMYSYTGKLDDYIESMLYIRYNYFHGFGREIESYSNSTLVPGYTVLEEHSKDRLVWVEPFEDTASGDHNVVYIRYEEVPDGEYWKVDKWEIIDS